MENDRLRRCDFRRGGNRCNLAVRHGGSHVMAPDDGDDYVQTLEFEDAEPVVWKPSLGHVPVRTPGEALPDEPAADPGVVALLRTRPGVVTPVNERGIAIPFFDCPSCDGNGCEVCEYSGKRRTRAWIEYVNSIHDKIAGRERWHLVGDCPRCGLAETRLCKPGNVVDVPMCRTCMKEVMTVYLNRGRDERDAAAAEAMKPLPPERRHPQGGSRLLCEIEGKS